MARKTDRYLVSKFIERFGYLKTAADHLELNYGRLVKICGGYTPATKSEMKKIAKALDESPESLHLKLITSNGGKK